MKKFLMTLAAVLSLSAPLAAQVDPGEDAALKARLEEQFRDSKEIHARFVDRYYWDNSPQIQVEVMNGNVILRGFVQDSEAKEAYEKIARQTPGVKNVDVRIRVIPSERKVD